MEGGGLAVNNCSPRPETILILSLGVDRGLVYSFDRNKLLPEDTENGVSRT